MLPDPMWLLLALPRGAAILAWTRNVKVSQRLKKTQNEPTKNLRDCCDFSAFDGNQEQDLRSGNVGCCTKRRELADMSFMLFCEPGWGRGEIGVFCGAYGLPKVAGNALEH